MFGTELSSTAFKVIGTVIRSSLVYYCRYDNLKFLLHADSFLLRHLPMVNGHFWNYMEVDYRRPVYSVVF
jgi:hypothetical protein